MPPKPSVPRRPSVSEIALALAQRPRSEPVSTVELTFNARGDTQIKVVVDDVDPRAASAACSKLYDELVRKYPRKENGA